MATTLSSLSSRIRILYSNKDRTIHNEKPTDETTIPIISVKPVTLCSGMIALNHDDGHHQNNARSFCHTVEKGQSKNNKIRNLDEFQEIHRLTKDVILDHCWTTVPKSVTRPNEDFRSMLVLLVKHNSHDAQTRSVMSIQIFCRESIDSVAGFKIGNNDQNYSLVRSIDLHFLANSMAISKHIIAIGSSTGIIICNIVDLLQSSERSSLNEIVKKYKLMTSCVVHAMHFSFPYLAAASGDRVGLWRVDRILDCRREEEESVEGSTDDAAVWTTKIHRYRARVTCIYISGEETDSERLLALSCWDGSAFVFRNHGADDYWERLKVDSFAFHDDDTSPYPWEEATAGAQERVYPTTLVLFSIKDPCFQRNFMAVSYPGSCNVRCYDLDLGLRYDDFSIPNKSDVSSCQQVQGMVALNKVQYTESTLIWIDENDKIFEHLWPQYGTYMSVPPSLTYCKHHRIHLASWHRSKSLVFNAWLEFDNGENTWIMQCNWLLDDLNEVRNFETSTRLDFLDNWDIFNFILSSNKKIENKEGLCGFDRHRKGAQFVFNADLFGVLLPSDSVIFVFGREANGWKTVDLRNICEEEESGWIRGLLAL